MFSSDIQIQIRIRYTPQPDYGYGQNTTSRARLMTHRRDVVRTALEEAMDIMSQVNMADVQYGYHLENLELKGLSSSSPLYPKAVVEMPIATPALRPEEVLLIEMGKGGSVDTSI